MDIKKIRNEFQMSIAEFADIVGVSAQTIHNWEKGGKIPNSKISNLNKIFESIRQKLGYYDQKIISEPGIQYDNDDRAFTIKLMGDYVEQNKELNRLRKILDDNKIKY